MLSLFPFPNPTSCPCPLRPLPLRLLFVGPIISKHGALLKVKGLKPIVKQETNRDWGGPRLLRQMARLCCHAALGALAQSICIPIPFTVYCN